MTTDQTDKSAPQPDPQPGKRRALFQVAPQEDLLYSLAADGSRRWMDPVVAKGRFFRIRQKLAYFLVALFVLLPHIPIAGKPAIFLDIAQRQFTFFGTTLHPTDNLILLAFGGAVIVSLFAVTALFGRLWCGFACPQPIYLEFIYRPIERLLEGRPTVRRKRDSGPWNLDRLWRKTIKWLLYALLSLFFCATFVSYFVGWQQLWHGLLHNPLHNSGALFAILVLSAAMFVDFAYFRDQMCTVACPYGRLQTVLYDQDTVIVGYSNQRGEPRASKRDRVGDDPWGDCIDCGRCVRTCPTGMDIRRGLQMECIGCAQCVDGCNEVMARTKRPPGLISFTSLRQLDGEKGRFKRPRVYVYGLLLTVFYGALLVLALGRSEASAEIIRSAREPYRILPTGQVANLLRVRLTNNQPQELNFTIELTQPDGAELVVSRSPFAVAGTRVATVDVVAKVPQQAFRRGRVKGTFVITSDSGAQLNREFMLLGPYQ